MEFYAHVRERLNHLFKATQLMGMADVWLDETDYMYYQATSEYSKVLRSKPPSFHPSLLSSYKA